MRAVILAGGFGTRLKSRVQNVPKPFAPIGDRPFLEFVLDRLDRDGFSEVILAVGYLHEVIQKHFGSRYRGINIEYAVENDPLGTGGALQFALSFVSDSNATVLVLNGDTFLDLDYRALVGWFELASPQVAMVLRHVENAGRYGRVEVTGSRITKFLEKGLESPGYINAGVYVLRPATLAAYKFIAPFSLEREFFEMKLAELEIASYPSDAYFVDIGIPADYDRAQVDLPKLVGR